MKYLITGNKGFIGSNLEKYLKENFETVYGMDIKEGSHWADVSSYESTVTVVRKYVPDVVIHLAAVPGVFDCETEPNLAFDTNIQGTFNVLLACGKWGPKRVVLASSAAADQPTNLYAASKASMEAMARSFSNVYGMDISCLRFSNVYGPGSMYKSSVVASFIKGALLNKRILIEGDGFHRRDFVYIDDVCKAIEKIANINKGFNVYDVGSGEQVSIMALATKLRSIMEFDIKFIPERKNDIAIPKTMEPVSNLILSQTDLDDGLMETVKWFRTQEPIRE